MWFSRGDNLTSCLISIYQDSTTSSTKNLTTVTKKTTNQIINNNNLIDSNLIKSKSKSNPSNNNNNNNNNTTVRIIEASTSSEEEEDSIKSKNKNSPLLLSVTKKLNSNSTFFSSKNTSMLLNSTDSIGSNQVEQLDICDCLDCDGNKSYQIDELEEFDETLSGSTLSRSSSYDEEEGEEEGSNSSSSINSLPSLSRSPLFDDDEDEEEDRFYPYTPSPPTSTFTSTGSELISNSRRRKSISKPTRLDPLITSSSWESEKNCKKNHQIYTFNTTSSPPRINLISTTSNLLSPIITKDVNVLSNLLEVNSSVTKSSASVSANSNSNSSIGSSALTKSLLRLVKLPNLIIPKVTLSLVTPLLPFTSSTSTSTTPTPSNSTSTSTITSIYEEEENISSSLVSNSILLGIEDSTNHWSCELNEFDYENQRESEKSWSKSNTTPIISSPPSPSPSTSTSTKSSSKSRKSSNPPPPPITQNYTPPQIRLISNQKHLLMLSLEISMIQSGKILFPLRQRAITIMESNSNGNDNKGSCLRFEVV